MANPSDTAIGGIPAIHIEVALKDQPPKNYRFSGEFRVGRDESCEICLEDQLVSRFHLRFFIEDGHWWAEDLQSTNGTFQDGKKIERIPLREDIRLELGQNGVVLSIGFHDPGRPVPGVAAVPHSSVTRYIERYFQGHEEGKMGEHTRLLREAFNRLQKKQTSKYLKIVAGVGLIALLAGGYGLYQHIKTGRQRVLAENIFYSMKSLELQLLNLEKRVTQTGDSLAVAEMQKNQSLYREMQQSYDQFMEELGIYTENMSEEERIIFQMARVFGECEITMPEDFVEEVRKYIEYWQATTRLEDAIQRAQQLDIAPQIGEILLEEHLPPQFFYVSLQESDFKRGACGPRTRFGIAKGIWQFIPSTAAYYGLKTGPLVDLRRHDPLDERYDVKKATRAAARFIRDMYDTEAQASGLLVIASYNWGSTNMRKLIRNMSNNPRERNFWRLLAEYRDQIPRETYDYVFYIISAAVIGENPSLFGFKFENPLAKVMETASN